MNVLGVLTQVPRDGHAGDADTGAIAELNIDAKFDLSIGLEAGEQLARVATGCRRRCDGSSSRFQISYLGATREGREAAHHVGEGAGHRRPGRGFADSEQRRGVLGGHVVEKARPSGSNATPRPGPTSRISIPRWRLKGTTCESPALSCS